MDKKDLGKKIQMARQQRGLTQEEVELRLKLPQKSMTRMESGQRHPSTLELVKLAELFQMPINDLLNWETIEEDPVIALYRVAPGLESDSSIREEVNRCIYLCKEGISLQKLLNQPQRQRVLFSNPQRPFTAFEAIRQGELVAKEERKRLGVNNLPIRNISELIASQGIWCAATLLPEEMSGLFLHHSSIGGMVILINAAHGAARQQFSYAHEYAHALFDADRQVLISESENSLNFIEKRANAFAAAFLMPEEGIAETLYSLNKGHPSRIQSSIFDVSTEKSFEAEERQSVKNQKLSPQDVAFLAYRFGVSYQAAVYRLHTLRYLTQKERESLLDEESKGRDYLRLLDLEDVEPILNAPSLQRELRTCLSRLIIEAYRQGKISRGRVIELCKPLQLPPQELLQLATSNE